MKFAPLIMLLLTAPAMAHPALAPHAHPHGLSALPDYLALLFAGAMIGVGYAAFRTWRRR